MNRLIRTLSGIVTLALLAGSTHAANITMKGSDTLVILAQKWAEVYMQKNPDTKIQVTGVGLLVLQSRESSS